MRKKIFCLVMVFVLLFALSACKSDVTSDATTNAVSSEAASDTEHTVSGSTESGSDPVTSEDDASGADTGSKTASTASAGTTSKGTTSKAGSPTKTSSTSSKSTTSKTSSTSSKSAPKSNIPEGQNGYIDKYGQTVNYVTNKYGVKFSNVVGSSSYKVYSFPDGALGIYDITKKNKSLILPGCITIVYESFTASTIGNVKPYYHKSNLTTMIDFADEPLLYYKLDGTTSTTWCYFANYYLAPGEGVYTGDDPNKVYENKCPVCGLPHGLGPGMCNYNFTAGGYNCYECGEYVDGHTCHHCKGSK